MFMCILLCHMTCITCHMVLCVGPIKVIYLFLFKVDFISHWYCAWWRPEGRNVAINKFNWSSIFQCADFTPSFSFKLLSCPAPEPDLGIWDVHTCLVFLILQSITIWYQCLYVRVIKPWCILWYLNAMVFLQYAKIFPRTLTKHCTFSNYL